MNRFAELFFCTALSAVLLCGCSQVEEDAPVTASETTVSERSYPVTVGSLAFEAAPETVGSLSPAITEIICELGCGDRLIGVSEYCDYPESVSELPKLGSAANPDPEAIIAAAPELLISFSPIAKKDITAIEAAGTRVWIVSPPETVPELYRCYEEIAAVFGGKTDCEKAADDALRPLVGALAKADGTMDSFVYIMSPELAAASDSTFAGNFFSCFGKNAAGDKDTLTAEELLELDPEWLVLPDSVNIYELPEDTAALSAVQSGRVIYLDDEVLERIERPTSRLEGVVYEILEQVESIEAEQVEETEESEE